MMIRRMVLPRVVTHDDRQSPEFHALATFCEPHGLAATRGRRKRGINETFPLVDRTFVPQRGDQLGEDLPQYLPLTPVLEPTMDHFAGGIALRQEGPLSAGVQNPEHRLQDRLGRHGPAAGTAIQDVFFRKSAPEIAPIDRRADAA